MKNLVVPATLLLFLSAAGAQEAPQSTLTLNRHQDAPAHSSRFNAPPTPPNLCKPCVFYGGDNNVWDPNTDGFANENTLSVPFTTTYTAVDVPKTTHGVITGIMFMITPSIYFADFNPPTATYDIRVGVSDGNGGTSLASGSGPMAYAIAQESDFGTVYATAVNLATPLTVNPGTRYWFNLSPQCTDGGDQNCSKEGFWEDNTTQETNGLNADAQPPHQMFFNSAYFGYTWTNWCDPAFGLNSQQCARASFGLMGQR